MSEHLSPGGLSDALTEIVADHDQQKQTFVDPVRLVGDVIPHRLHDNRCSLARQRQTGRRRRAAGMPAGRGQARRRRPSRPGAPRLLLRVVSSAPLPNDMSMRQARFDAAQRVAASTGNWDDSGSDGPVHSELDEVFGVRCRVLGTYQPPADTGTRGGSAATSTTSTAGGA